MRMNKCVSIFGATAGAFLLLLVLSESALSIGVCRKATCPCSSDQEKQGMKMIGGQCTDCAGNAKELARLQAQRLELGKKLQIAIDQSEEHYDKVVKSWKSVQEELPTFRTISGDLADLLKRSYEFGKALGTSSPAGARELSKTLEQAYHDVSRLAKFMDPLGTLVPDLFRDVSDSVLNERLSQDFDRQWSELKHQENELDKQIEEKRALQDKCSGKGKKKSELDIRQEPRVYASHQPAFLRLVASGGSSGRAAPTPCSGSPENLERCAEAERVMRDMRSFDLPQTNFAVGEALRILEPFGQGNANKITDQEVLQRAKQAAGALDKLVVPLDHMVSNSKKVLTLLQGGGT